MYTDMYDANCIIAGSKGEGITRYFENDIDVMTVSKLDIKCTEDVNHRRENNLILLQMDTRLTAPGYTRLRSNYVIPDEHVTFDMFDRDISIGYVTHSLSEQQLGDMTVSFYFPKQGPAFCYKPMLGQQVDRVPSIKCDCPSILVAWLSRRRDNDWPSQETVAEVSTMDAHVVSVGYKHSPHKNIEWRICYTLAELALIHSLNDTQLKMYVLLKFIAKSVLKPVCDAMTSYVMKNIVLWVCENTPSQIFTPRLLIDRLLQCLKILRSLVRHRSIPSYMIPERNLFIERKVPGQQQRLLTLLSELIDEGPCLLFRSDKLRLAMVNMYEIPEAVRQECQKKDQLERLVLLLAQCVGNCDMSIKPEQGSVEWLSDKLQTVFGSMLNIELVEHCFDMLLPDQEQLENAGENVKQVCIDRFIRQLS